jgi:HAD superfamily hydrolase (TIGR01509 family)
MQNAVRAVLFDFGGVIAEEGFHEGILAIARRNGLEPERFFRAVDAIIYETGYLTGRADEATFWNEVRRKTGAAGTDRDLRDEVLKRFVLRPDMVRTADRLRSRGLIVAILSDQTNWLDEMDRRTALSAHFDRVFNSFDIHKSKRDASLFGEVCAALGVKREETLFVDDNEDHIRRAKAEGLRTIQFTTVEDFIGRLGRHVPGVP